MAQHFVAFWNVENLFGPEDHPQRIPWVAERMARDLEGWSEALYARKQDRLAHVITRMNKGAGPDILGLCEVEDRFVLEDLKHRVGEELGRNYGIVHADNQHDKRGIDTAFLFDQDRYGVDPAHIFSHFVIRRTGTRDILQATFRTADDQEVILLANHWPSRSGGAEKSAGFRATAGETLAYWHQRIREEARDKERACILALGDFNDDPFDPSLRFNANATRERGDVERAESPKFYNFTWEYLSTEAVDSQGNPRLLDGSLYYKNDGNLFDQILAARPLLDRGAAGFKAVAGSAGIFALPEMVSHRTGQGPIRFGLPKGDPARNINEEGFSDHFPVKILLEDG